MYKCVLQSALCVGTQTYKKNTDFHNLDDNTFVFSGAVFITLHLHKHQTIFFHYSDNHTMTPIALGKKIPDVTAVTGDGATITFSALNGKRIVLYFYPKDDTSGCTKEACDFRDNMERITASDAVVIGVSPDGTKSHGKFTTKHNLNFQLISDESHTLCELFGVWVEKSMYGRKYMGVERSTFLIERDGTLLREWRKVSVTGHVDEVLSALDTAK
jgi:thioredoxin-dependent peroxiredoxin